MILFSNTPFKIIVVSDHVCLDYIKEKYSLIALKTYSSIVYLNLHTVNTDKGPPFHPLI